MTRLRFIFFIFLVLMALPIFRYYELSKDKDRFVSYSSNQSTITEINFLPRGKIVDRNNNQLALDIVRPTLLFNNQMQKEIVSNLAEAESISIFLNSNRRLGFENEIGTNFLKNARIRGNKTMNGKMMFLHQARIAFKIWTGIEVDICNETIKLLDQ